MVIINEEVDPKKMASAPPVYAEKNVTFIVNTSSLPDSRDVMLDMISGLKRTKTKTLYFNVNHGILDKADKLCYEYKVCRFIYCHQIHKDFHKVAITVSDQNEDNYL